MFGVVTGDAEAIAPLIIPYGLILNIEDCIRCQEKVALLSINSGATGRPYIWQKTLNQATQAELNLWEDFCDRIVPNITTRLQSSGLWK